MSGKARDNVAKEENDRDATSYFAKIHETPDRSQEVDDAVTSSARFGQLLRHLAAWKPASLAAAGNTVAQVQKRERGLACLATFKQLQCEVRLFMLFQAGKAQRSQANQFFHDVVSMCIDLHVAHSLLRKTSLPSCPHSRPRPISWLFGALA